MLSCLQNQASKYNRGGVLTKASSVLTPICTGIGAFAPVRNTLSALKVSMFHLANHFSEQALKANGGNRIKYSNLTAGPFGTC